MILKTRLGYELSDKEFETTIIGNFKGKKNQRKVLEIKKHSNRDDGFISRLDTIDKHISELEGRVRGLAADLSNWKLVASVRLKAEKWYINTVF